MYCTNCGKEIKSEYKFCPKCGNSIINSDNNISLYDSVVSFISSLESVSIPMVQKEFSISYKDASKIMKDLEANGMVGPANGRKGREVLVEKKEEVKESNKEKKSKNSSKIIDRLKDVAKRIMNTPDYTGSYDEKDIKDNTFLSVLSYMGLLVFIPYFVNSDSKFVKFHSKEGMNLLIIWVCYTGVDNLLSLIKVSEVVVDFGTMIGTRMVTPLWISIPLDILSMALVIISIIGVVNVLQGKVKELPIINKIKIIK